MGQQNRSDLTSHLDIVVDADAHLTEPFEELRMYMDDGVASMFDSSMNRFIDIFSHVTPSPHAGEPMSGNLTDESVSSGEVKLQNMEEWGIDRAITSGTFMLAINTINNPHIASGVMRAYNEWIQETFDHERIENLMIAAGQVPSEAAEEIERHADEFVGVSLPTPGLIPPLGHHFYDPIYEAAEDNDLPIVQHSATGGWNFTFPTQYNWSQTYAEAQALSHPFHLMWNVTTSLYWGLPERFPDLDLVYQEAGLGWVPYLMGRLDDHYLTHGEQMPHLKKLPSEYMRDNYYFTTQPLEHMDDPAYNAQWVDMVGPDSVMYSADFPHPSFDPPDELYKRLSAHFEEPDIKKIFGGNAKQVFLE